MTINVTQDCIDAADWLRENDPELFGPSECCPIALALKSQGFPDAWVGGGVLIGGCVNDGNCGHPVDGLGQRISAWDHFQEMEPFSFELPG